MVSFCQKLKLKKPRQDWSSPQKKNNNNNENKQAIKQNSKQKIYMYKINNKTFLPFDPQTISNASKIHQRNGLSLRDSPGVTDF